MADPLSAAGLAVGVVSLGIQVAGGITKYIDALNCREKEIASVRRQNDALKKSLQVVETLRTQFQSNHEAATAVVQGCLESCKKELDGLESLVANLSDFDKTSASHKEKLKNKGKKLLYPLNRGKVEQLESRISSANASLQLTLQTLGLSVTKSNTEMLAALEATSQAISIRLLTAQSSVSAMERPLQEIHSTVSTFATRVDTLEILLTQLLAPQSAREGTSCQIAPATASARLLEKPSLLRDICDAAGTSASTGPSQMQLATTHGTTRFGKNVSTYTRGRFSCMCSHRRHVKREDIIWGSLAFSFETVSEKHLPGCPATQIIVTPDRSRSFSVTYTGLRYLLNSAIQLSFAMPWGAGAWSLSPNFTYYPIVDSETAPAFRILSLLEESWYCSKREEFVPSAIAAILRLFRAKKASPRAVDADNRSLVYPLVRCMAMDSSEYRRLLPNQANSSPLLDLLESLLANKAPANDYDSSGNTPPTGMFDSLGYCSVIDPLPAAATELILRLNINDNVVFLSDPSPAAHSTIYDRSGRHISAEGGDVLLHFLGCSRRAAEAYGCGLLSVEVLSENLGQVENLSKNHPATLGERNLFGHTPLHLAADKPSCLRLLAEASDSRILNLEDRPGQFGKSPLETAVFLGGRHCQEHSSRRRTCQDCGCSECAVILLDADCAVPVPEGLQGVFRLASTRCKLEYIRHMKDRRDRLKQLALENLPESHIEQAGLNSERALDSLAPRVIQLLEERNVAIPEALPVARDRPLSVYQEICCPEDAELFFHAGFHDTDSWCRTDVAELQDIPNPCQDLAYLRWLGMHGAFSCQLKSFTSVRDIFAANFTFWKIGEDIRQEWPGKYLRLEDPWFPGESPPSPSLDDRRAWVHELHSTVLPANIANQCRCKCSPGRCTPIVSLLKGVVDKGTFASSPGYLAGRSVADESVAESEAMDSPVDSGVERADDRPMDNFVASPPSMLASSPIEHPRHFGADLTAEHHLAIVRYLTFTALGIPHTCCDPFGMDYYLYEDFSIYSLEDEVEAGDRHAYELGLFEDLLGEFEGQVTAILQNPGWEMADLIAFWRRTWMGRMEGIRDHLQGSDLRDDERRAAEEVGVVWDTPEPQPQPAKVADNAYRKDTLEHWLYELGKIEAACQ